MHLFYQPLLKNSEFSLENEEYQHCVQVLRHKEGSKIMVTDGEGLMMSANIKSISKRNLQFEIVETISGQPKPFYHHLAIAPTKSIDRMEWMIEKLGELRVDEVSLIYSENSERRKIRVDRLIKKAISAMKQSKSDRLLKINEPIQFKDWVKKIEADSTKYIAVVDHGNQHISESLFKADRYTTLIGPEGDFSEDEVSIALANEFEPISLGCSVLRTETAGIYISSAINLFRRF